jgi:putative FmdB family regulatory protein
MPIYEYRPAKDSDAERNCTFCTSGFELLRKISDPDLTTCPECGAAVERALSAPNLARSDTSLDPANVEKHGFTQYKKSGKGVYEKTAGKGPNVISDNSD